MIKLLLSVIASLVTANIAAAAIQKSNADTVERRDESSDRADGGDLTIK
jgi:hypothetical protein